MLSNPHRVLVDLPGATGTSTSTSRASAPPPPAVSTAGPPGPDAPPAGAGGRHPPRRAADGSSTGESATSLGADSSMQSWRSGEDDVADEPRSGPGRGAPAGMGGWMIGTTDALRRSSGSGGDAGAPPASSSPPPSPPRRDASPNAGGGAGGGDAGRRRRNTLPPGSRPAGPAGGPDAGAGAADADSAGGSTGSGDVPRAGSGTTLSALSQPHLPPAPIPREPASPYASLYQERLFDRPSPAAEAVLSAACEAVGFDIAEVWLRTGPKTHQLTNSHLRPAALEDSLRAELVDVYYGERSSERTHRLSPALCKRAREAQDVVWVTSHTEHGAEALRCSISDVRTAVAVPVCHESSNTNVTLIFFAIRRAIMRPQAVEFLIHMSLATAVSSVNSLAEDIAVDRPPSPSPDRASPPPGPGPANGLHIHRSAHQLSRSADRAAAGVGARRRHHHHPRRAPSGSASAPVIPSAPDPAGGGTLSPGGPGGAGRGRSLSVTGAPLDLRWGNLKNVEYLTDGGNNWIHTAVMDGKPVVVKTLKPECQDLALAINEIELELQIHSKLDHPNIVSLMGAGTTSKGSRFVVLERLDGGTLTQMLGYDNRIRDRRRRFWRKRQLSYLDVLRCAKSIADAMDYCHSEAVPGSMVLHRDIKPSNVGFTLDGTVKLIDFGLARIVENARPETDEAYVMSGETGSLRYMAPEVADCRPYNHKADVYSFGIILWEIVSFQKPFNGMGRDEFYARVVHGGERPPLGKRWPAELTGLMVQCWDSAPEIRPTFREIREQLDGLLSRETGGRGGGGVKRVGGGAKRRIMSLIERHSTWF